MCPYLHACQYPFVFLFVLFSPSFFPVLSLPIWNINLIAFYFSLAPTHERDDQTNRKPNMHAQTLNSFLCLPRRRISQTAQTRPNDETRRHYSHYLVCRFRLDREQWLKKQAQELSKTRDKDYFEFEGRNLSA